METLSLSENHNHAGPGKRETEANVLKQVIVKAARYWYLFIISVVICLGVARIYLRYSVPVYSVESRFLLKKQTTGAAPGSLMSQVDGSDNTSDVQNEIEVLLTKYLMKRVVHDLQLNVSIFSKGIMKSTELYGTAPFRIQLVNIDDSVETQSWFVSLDTHTGQPLLANATGTRSAHWGDTIRLRHAAFMLLPNPNVNFPEGGLYLLNLVPEDLAALGYLGRVAAMPVADGVNIIKVTMVDPIPRRGEDVLNTLYDEYVKANIEDQNALSDNTISFIDSRLEIVSKELSGVEQHIQDFKSQNKLVDLGQQSSMVTANANDLEKQIAQLDAQLDILGAVENQLNSGDYRVVPTSLVTQNPAYIALVEKFNADVLHRDVLLETSKEQNPVVQELDGRIEGVRKDLKTELGNIRSEMNINRSRISSRLSALEGQIQDIPAKQRAFLDVSRQQEVKQQLYLYLLQKREETAISKSGTLSHSRLIEPAVASGIPVSPNNKNIYLIGLAVGLLLPAAFVYLKEAFDNKVREKRDIFSQTETPILGEIGHNKSGEAIVVANNARSLIAEQFRSIRTNLRFWMTNKDRQVVLVTSSMSGEGKSFISLNLAATMAISGKKVVLLELDLRKPRLSSLLGFPPDTGFTNFVVSNTDLKYLPKPVPGVPNLYLVGSGPIPPNPAELLMTHKVKDLFEYLYANFDFVVIDTPPIGLVSDALLVSSYADACLYVTRQGFTFRQQIGIVDDLFTHKKMKGLSILFNDVDAKKGKGYGYGYGYGNGSYYYEAERKRGWKKVLQPSSKNS